MIEEKITVEIKGVYLEILNRLAEEYNNETIELWNNKKSIFLREKEDAQSFLKHVIVRYMLSNHKDMYDEIMKSSEKSEQIELQDIVIKRLEGTNKGA